MQPPTLKDETTQAEIARHALDVLVVAAYGLILPQRILDLPRHGCLNIHASLLPRWRGAAPIQRALLEGDPQTGISIMQMDAGLDTGAVISAHAVPIDPSDSAATLTARLAEVGGKAIVETLFRLQRDGRLDAIPQPSVGSSYAGKVSRDDASIDWHASALSIERQVRALNPVPGAVTILDGNPVKIWTAKALPGKFGAPGTVVRTDGATLVVACGEGTLAVCELQRAGGRRMAVAEFLSGNRIEPGKRLGASVN